MCVWAPHLVWLYILHTPTLLHLNILKMVRCDDSFQHLHFWLWSNTQGQEEYLGFVFPHFAPFPPLRRLLHLLRRLHIEEQSSKKSEFHLSNNFSKFSKFLIWSKLFFGVLWSSVARSGSDLMCKVWRPTWKVQVFLFQPSPSATWKRLDFVSWSHRKGSNSIFYAIFHFGCRATDWNKTTRAKRKCIHWNIFVALTTALRPWRRASGIRPSP